MGKLIVLQHVLTRELIHFSILHRYIEPQVQAKKDNERRKELGVMDAF